jgi:hypothetical protein
MASVVHLRALGRWSSSEAAMASGWRWLAAAALCAGPLACAHGSRSSERIALTIGQYQVESIRSRATLDGVDRMVEISESGTRMVDASGAEHTLTERGALVLSSEGRCRLALAVSVDGEEPGISDRSCTWETVGDIFFLGDGRDGARTAYRIRRIGDRFVLEGLKDLGPNGEELGDASGERIVLVQAPQRAQGSTGPIHEAKNTGADELPISEL